MLIKKTELVFEFEYDFLLYGIVSQEKPYRLAWLFNKIHPYNFVRIEDYELEIIGKQLVLAQYLFIDEENHTNYFLIANKDDNNHLLPELKNFDFILIIKGALDFFEEVQLKGAIKKISAVQIIYPIEVDKLKSKNHLIYV